MSYQGLLKEGKIKPHQSCYEEIKSILEVADRDMNFARQSMAHSWDWAFTIAYNASLSAARAYMYHLGYRPATPESHKTVWMFMLLALPKEYHDCINFFNRMRIKRHKNLYDHVGLISETEVREIINSTEEYIRDIKELIER